MGTTVSRRRILAGTAGAAAAALLAACGGGNATDTPKPSATTGAAPATAGAAPTTGAGAATTAAGGAATRSAGSAPASTAAPAATTASGTTASSGSAVSGSAASGSTSAVAATAKPDAFKGKTLGYFQGLEYYKAVQDYIKEDMTAFVKSGGGSADISVGSDQGAQNIAKVQAGVESGSAFDLVHGGAAVQQIVALNIATDVTDLVAELTRKYGDVMPIVPKGLQVNGKWYAVPWATSSDVWFLRKDKFEAKGIKPEGIQTYEQMRDAALAISDPASKFYGWGNSPYPTGDGTTLVFHVIHNWGGAITNKEGTKVTFNSPETIAGVTWLADIYQNPKYKPMLPPGWESWNDSANNEAYLTGSIGITANAFTLYAKARDDKNPVFANTITLPRPVGPAHPEGLRGGSMRSLYIPRNAKNAELAKDVIRHMMEPAVWNKLASNGGGLILPAYESHWKADYMTGDFRKDPNFAPLETQVRDKAGYNQIYYPADQNAGTDGVNSQNVLIDMMAQILQKRVKVPEAVKDAHDRMVKIFEQLGQKQ